MGTQEDYHSSGPSGGIGGFPFYLTWPSGAFKIVAVWGRSGSRIDQIGLDWSTKNGIVSSPPCGGGGGSPFKFDIPADDYLTDIFGTVDNYNGSIRVFSLKLVTKGKVVGTYGTQEEYQFSYTSPPGYQVISIFGRAGNQPGSPPAGALDALGVTIEPIV